MNIDFAKYPDGLAPAIVQDAATLQVLMLGFMNADALEQTRRTGRVAFYSRSRQQLWTKGETSGNFLEVVSISPDCDADTLLIKARPAGPVCHSGDDTCFGEVNGPSLAYLSELFKIIDERRRLPSEDSHTSRLFARGLNKIAQKVGEEAVELVIAAKDEDQEAFLGEAADLLFHYLVLLNAKDAALEDVIEVLLKRRR